ncbi:hypothetical protein K501DRAFT_225859 [Backusella circina FSU 941]|nr:hypothetical protein K501DRAFT_225859 [Backusella circina FSU 941]
MLRNLQKTKSRLPFTSSKAGLTTSTRRVRCAQATFIDDATTGMNPAFITNKQYSVLPTTYWKDIITNKNSIIKPFVPQETLTEKSMSNSYFEEYLPFKSNPALLEDYITTNGKIRVGRILEELDSAAGIIGCKHANISTDSIHSLVVTAGVDRTKINMPNTVEDLKISGNVASVGSSAMEVILNVEAVSPRNQVGADSSSNKIVSPTANSIMTAKFTMVLVDPKTNKGRPTFPLKIRNEQERKLMEYAVTRKAQAKSFNQSLISKVPPTLEERQVLHDLFVEYPDQDKPIDSKNAVWVNDTSLDSVVIVQPQNRNIYGKAFGGYLMRSAFELAQASGQLFAQSDIKLSSFDDVVFKNPVELGSLLKMKSQVVRSGGSNNDMFQVRVLTETVDMKKGFTSEANAYCFTFKSNKQLRKVVPKTYAESMSFIEAGRRLTDVENASECLMKLTCKN